MPNENKVDRDIVTITDNGRGGKYMIIPKRWANYFDGRVEVVLVKNGDNYSIVVEPFKP